VRIRIIGIGTSFGDDAAGLGVVRHLAAEWPLPRGVEAVPCHCPLDLVELLEGVDAAVLVDATCSGRAPGAVHEPLAEELREARPVSSHGLGVPEALAMARAIGRAPPRIAIIGIEAASTAGSELSPPVRAALAEAAARARRRCAAWIASDGQPPRASPYA
jgi:hydrogenase maturation protease